MKPILLFITISISVFSKAQLVPDSSYLDKTIRKSLKNLQVNLEDAKLTTFSCARWCWSYKYESKDGTTVLLYFDSDKIIRPKTKDRKKFREKLQNPKRYLGLRIIRIRLMDEEGMKLFVSMKYWDE